MFFTKRTLTLILVLILFCFIFGDDSKTNNNDESYKYIGLFTEIFQNIRENYYEDREVKDLIYGAINGMVGTLDPFSQFLPPKNYDDMQVETKGEFGGLGIVISLRDGVLTVVSPIEGTPADKVGVKSGDKILKIEGKSTQSLSLEDAVKRLRGRKGTKVTISVFRKGYDDLIDFTIIRDIIKIKVVTYKILEQDIGYIRLKEFSAQANPGLQEALDFFDKRDDIIGLILDLRNNPGGLLKAAVDVASNFIDEGKLIVYTKSRIEGQNNEFKSKPLKHHKKLPLIVLVNHGSASASEIVSGAIKDWGRGILLGTKTFGKGSVQTVLPLEDASGLRLTTAHYYTPKGYLIHNIGIEPDIKVDISKLEEYKLRIKKEEELLKEKSGKSNRINNLFLKYAPKSDTDVTQEDKSETLPETDIVYDTEPALFEGSDTLHKFLKDFHDLQLERAVNILKGAYILNKNFDMLKK